MSNELPDELISQYLTHDDTIKALRNEQASIKLKKLDPSMLIRCGVSAAKIEDCTTVSEGVPHLRVSRPKE